MKYFLIIYGFCGFNCLDHGVSITKCEKEPTHIQVSSLKKNAKGLQRFLIQVL